MKTNVAPSGTRCYDSDRQGSGAECPAMEWKIGKDRMEQRVEPPRHAIRDDWIPREEYVDPERAALERDWLWPNVWQIACRDTDLKAVGDYIVYDILDDTILVVRSGPGPDDVYAAYNVCQHRGRRLYAGPSGNVGARISCKYHGWQYDAEGNLAHVPFESDFADCPAFDKARLALPRVRLERWGGWIWINQDEHCEPLADFLGEAARLIDPFEPENMRAVWHKTLIAPVPWKVILEAFNESYHAIPTHNSNIVYNMNSPARMSGLHGNYWFEQLSSAVEGAGTAGTRYRKSNGKWTNAKSIAETIWAAHKVLDDMLFAMTLEPTMEAARRLRGEAPPDSDPAYVMQRFWELQQDEMARRGVKWPERLTPEAVEACGVSWHIFPNAIVLPTVDGALWYRFRPHRTDPGKCILDLWSFGRFAPGEEPEVSHETFDGFEAFKGQNPFLEEDFPNVAGAADGMKCRGWRGAVINPKQEATVSGFHKNLAEFIEQRRR